MSAVPAADFASSETKKNVLKAFSGECVAKAQYTFFASKARKEGYEQIAAIFLETAGNEGEHAKIFLKFAGGDGAVLDVPMLMKAFKIGTILECLKLSAEGEFEEESHSYPAMAAVAEKEGFMEIAQAFRSIASVEAEHERRFKLLAEQVESGTFFKKTRTVTWKCRNCGYVLESTEAPEKCPACAHPRAYFEVRAELE